MKELEGRYFSYDLKSVPVRIAELGADLIGLRKIDSVDCRAGTAWFLIYNLLGEPISAQFRIREIIDYLKLLEISDEEAKEYIKKNSKQIKKDKKFYTGKKGSWRIYGITNEYSLLRIIIEVQDGTMVQIQDHIKSPGYIGSRLKIDKSYLVETTMKEWNQKKAYYKTLSI